VRLRERELRETAFLVSTEILIMIIAAVAGAAIVCRMPAAPRSRRPDDREDDIEAAS